jgi:acetoacetate decarboxylase
MSRPISFEQAKARYVHRFTMEHVPAWARSFCTFKDGRKYYAPQFRTDREWYDATLFYGESELATKKSCYTSGQTWPLGQWLAAPYTR